MSDHDLVVRRSKVLRSRNCLYHQQRVNASKKAAAEKKKLNFLVLVTGESDKVEYILLAKVLFQFNYFVNKDIESAALEIVQYMRNTPSLDGVNNALGCLCLQWATADRRENKSHLNEAAEKTFLPQRQNCFRLFVFRVL